MSEEQSAIDPVNEEAIIQPEAEANPPSVAWRRGSRSLFAPVVMIGAGVFFLLDNLGVIGGLNWQAAWSFWPLALILVGLNVLAVQLRPPLGSVLSALLGLAAVITFGYLLLHGSPDAWLRSLGWPEAPSGSIYFLVRSA